MENIGTTGRLYTFYETKGVIYAHVGSFFGNLNELEKEVKTSPYLHDTLTKKEYDALIKFIKIKLLNK